MHSVFKTASLATAFGLALALLGSGGARADLIQNGNFADGLSGWTTSGNLSYTTTPYFGLASNFPSGTTLAVLNAGNVDPNDALSQIFSTTAGTSYVLSFNYGSNDRQQQSVTAELDDTASETVLARQFETAPDGEGTLEQFSLAFTAISSSTTVLFTDYPGNDSFDSDGGLTGVSIPEPGSLTLLAIGAGGLLVRRRRQSN
jgi:hypothetical protein